MNKCFTSGSFLSPAFCRDALNPGTFGSILSLVASGSFYTMDSCCSVHKLDASGFLLSLIS